MFKSPHPHLDDEVNYCYSRKTWYQKAMTTKVLIWRLMFSQLKNVLSNYVKRASGSVTHTHTQINLKCMYWFPQEKTGLNNLHYRTRERRNPCIQTGFFSSSLLVSAICSKQHFPGARWGDGHTTALVWLCKSFSCIFKLLIIQTPLRISVRLAISCGKGNI